MLAMPVLAAKRKSRLSSPPAIFLISFSRKGRKLPTEELANESRSTHITVAADMVFSLSHYLSGVRSQITAPLHLLIFILLADSHRRLCPGADRCVMEGNSVLWNVSTSPPFQPAKACRNLVL